MTVTPPCYALVYGPAYLDHVLDIEQPLLSMTPAFVFDQSIAATAMIPRDDGIVFLAGPSGDLLRFLLPTNARSVAASYYLHEPLFARLLGDMTTKTLHCEYAVSHYHSQVGGMGAGYALAFGGLLRSPFGKDETAKIALTELASSGVHTLPVYLADCSSDISLVILSPVGDKLCVGVRQAMLRWSITSDDQEYINHANMLIFCGAPHYLLAAALAYQPQIPVMCAPAMRNVIDPDYPLAEFAERIHYLALNELEWQHLPGKDLLRSTIPIISITNGAQGSRLLLRDAEYTFPAIISNGAINTNRAGETYASTFFKVMLREDPGFVNSKCPSTNIAKRAAQIATRQASRQLSLTNFTFPPDDWK